MGGHQYCPVSLPFNTPHRHYFVHDTFERKRQSAYSSPRNGFKRQSALTLVQNPHSNNPLNLFLPSFSCNQAHCLCFLIQWFGQRRSRLHDRHHTRMGNQGSSSDSARDTGRERDCRRSAKLLEQNSSYVRRRRGRWFRYARYAEAVV